MIGPGRARGHLAVTTARLQQGEDGARQILRITAATEESAERRAGWFLLGVGTGVAGLWTATLRDAFHGGLFTYAGTPEAGNIPAFHLAAEAGMAATSLAAGTALLRGAPQRRGAALTACGMLIYSSINSSGWLLHNRPALTAAPALTLAGALTTVRLLLRRAR